MCRLIIRADAALSIGAGHVMRCIALAQAWMRKGGEVVLATRTTIPWVKDRLENLGFPVVHCAGEYLPEEIPARLVADCRLAEQFFACRFSSIEPCEDDNPTSRYGSIVKERAVRESAVVETSGTRESVDAFPQYSCWVVLDGYHFASLAQRSVQAAGYNLLVVDDYSHLPEYSCNILLNQNVTASKFMYPGNVSSKLLGTRYVLLREEFLHLQTGPREVPAEACSILLTLGGGDMMHGLAAIADFLAAEELKNKRVRVVAGGVATSVWERALEGCKAEYEILEQVGDMAAQMRWADFCISAGGSTCWELCASGVPFAVLCVADNQLDIVRLLIASGAACGTDVSTLFAVINSAEKRREMLSRAKAIVDGRGADRVVAAMWHYRFMIRRASASHCRGVYDIAINPVVRQFFFSTDSIAYEDHERWFARRLEKALPFFVVLDSTQEVEDIAPSICPEQECSEILGSIQGSPSGGRDGVVVGYSRFEQDGGRVVISVALDPASAGRGLGSWIIEETTLLFWHSVPDVDVVYACVKRSNVASMKAFEKAGYVELINELLAECREDDFVNGCESVSVFKKERQWCL